MNPTTIDRKASSASQQGSTGVTHADERPASPSDTDRGSLEELNKIRDILFGAQTREHAQRMTLLETTLARIAAELKQDVAARFDGLQAALTAKVSDLTAQIKREHDARAQGLTDLQREMNELGKTIAANTTRLDQQATQESQDVRQRLVDQQQALLSEMQSKNDVLSKAMQGALDELRSEKVTRAALADLFVKSAQSLSGQTTPPRESSGLGKTADIITLEPGMPIASPSTAPTTPVPFMDGMQTRSLQELLHG